MLGAGQYTEPLAVGRGRIIPPVCRQSGGFHLNSTAPAMSDATQPPDLRAAAIEDDGTCDVDALLADVAVRLQQAGRRVRGLLMTYPEGRDSCACSMVLQDLHTRQTYLVSQPLGSGASGCRADTQGFARASEVLRRAESEAPDLVISNRFGGLEAAGGGFRQEVLALLSSDVPVLTAVGTRYLGAWADFTGGATVLPARAEAIDAWLSRTLAVPN